MVRLPVDLHWYLCLTILKYSCIHFENTHIADFCFRIILAEIFLFSLYDVCVIQSLAEVVFAVVIIIVQDH